MRLVFLFLFIFLFVGCVQSQGEIVDLKDKRVNRLLTMNISAFCSVKMNDEIGAYNAQLRIKNGSYWLEFRVKNNPADLIFVNGSYFERIGEKWLKFSGKSFEIAKEDGAFDPSFVLKIPNTNLNCSFENVNIEKPGNFTDFDSIFDELVENKSKRMESLGVNCNMFAFVHCGEFENHTTMRDVCDYCKKD